MDEEPRGGNLLTEILSRGPAAQDAHQISNFAAEAPPCAWFRRRQTAAAMEHDAEAWLRRLWRYLTVST